MTAKLTPPLFSRRERYSLVLFSCGFVAFSAIAHMLIGGAGSSMFPKFTVQSTPSPIVFVFESPTPRPTPKPTPTPPPTPPPPTPKVNPPPIHVNPPTVTRTDNNDSGPTEPPYIPAPEFSSAPSAIPVAPATATPEPSPTTAPIGAATEATFRYRAPLEYPEILAGSGIQGMTIVLVTIGPDGALIDASVEVSSGNAALDSAALACARESRYNARIVNGIPVAAQYTIVYEFKLDE